MKKIYFYLCSSIIILLVLGMFSCIKEYYHNDTEDTAPSEISMSIEEAKAYFESQIIDVDTRSDNNDDVPQATGLTPGDFTPKWDQAKTSQNKKLASVDVPINTQYRYNAIRSEFHNGCSKAYSVKITQKLIVVKDIQRNKKSQYILTLIPDKEYYAKNKGDISDKFLNSGDKGEFSGIAIYYSVYRGKTYRVNKYKNGEKIAGVHFFGDKTKHPEKAKRAQEILVALVTSSI